MLTIMHDPDGGIAGQAVLGNVPLYPAPTDPNVGYPDTDPDADFSPNTLEGFRYSLLGVAFDGYRLHATIYPDELYAQWCAIQTPMPAGTSDGGAPLYDSCVPSPAICDHGCDSVADGGAATRVNLINYKLCDEIGVCNCIATGCVDFPATQLVVLDLQFDGANVSGTVQMLTGSPHNVYLTAQ